MTDAAAPEPTPPDAPSLAARLDLYQRAGGIIAPLLTALFAFLIGGLVVLATGTTRSGRTRDLRGHRA